MYLAFEGIFLTRYAYPFFERTPHVRSEDTSPTPCLTLHRFLCHHAMLYIFGGSEAKLATKQKASRMAAKRKTPCTTIYILSNNAEHEKNMVQLFRDVPSRFVRLRQSQFFTPEQRGDISESMLSIGQCASIYAAKKDHGLPLLLIKGGSAITYLGIDSNSKVIGGGVCPGMSIRCRALFDYCHKDFPSLGFDRYKEITDKAKLEKKPMSLFASDMEVGIAANATAELAGQLRNIVKQFLKLVGPTEEPATVIITGDDTEILMQLLEENCSGMIETEPDVVFPPPNKVVFSASKNMAPYGVKHLLQRNKKQQSPPNPDDEIREDLLGLRVVTYRKSRKTLYRGSISRVIPGKTLEEDTFGVLLDDGENIMLDLVQLYDAMALYLEVGEEISEENSEDWVGEKREALTKVQANLEGSSDKIKQRKTELDATKAKEGSIEKAVGPEEESRPAKRQKSTPKKKSYDPKKYVGQRIAKYFDAPTDENEDNQDIFFGTVASYSEEDKLWHILYDDFDEEDFDATELKEGVQEYAEHKDEDDKATS